jgi:hypothetical protein
VLSRSTGDHPTSHTKSRAARLVVRPPRAPGHTQQGWDRGTFRGDRRRRAAGRREAIAAPVDDRVAVEPVSKPAAKPAPSRLDLTPAGVPSPHASHPGIGPRPGGGPGSPQIPTHSPGATSQPGSPPRRRGNRGKGRFHEDEQVVVAHVRRDGTGSRTALGVDRGQVGRAGLEPVQPPRPPHRRGGWRQVGQVRSLLRRTAT